MDTAVVTTLEPERIVFLGSWYECTEFVRNNTWLYSNERLVMRDVTDNGLGRFISPMLWEAK